MPFDRFGFWIFCFVAPQLGHTVHAGSFDVIHGLHGTEATQLDDLRSPRMTFYVNMVGNGGNGGNGNFIHHGPMVHG